MKAVTEKHDVQTSNSEYTALVFFFTCRVLKHFRDHLYAVWNEKLKANLWKAQEMEAKKEINKLEVEYMFCL